MRTVILTTLHTLAIGILVGAPHQTNADQLPDAVTARLQTGEVVIARAWHGNTRRAKGNPGYEFHRLDPPSGDGEYEPEVVSYRPSFQVIEAFAGADIQAVHDAPRDSQFLVDKETRVSDYRVLVRTIVPKQPIGN